MTNTRPISDYSRQELHDLIWSAPATKLAADFGISDVAVAKRCKRLMVPRPPPGYWAKVAAGRRPRKPPLPPLPPTPAELLKANAQRRIPKALRLPETTEALIPVASQLLSAITHAKLDAHRRAHVEDRTLPAVTVSRRLADRAARAFQVIFKHLTPFGILYRKFQGSKEGGYFVWGEDRLYVAITEELVPRGGPRGNTQPCK